MTELTAPGGTSMGPLTRLGRDAQTTADELGDLADLVGTWVGTQGWELIAVPAEVAGRESFRFILRPYTEVVSFEPIGAQVPNRGYPNGDMFIYGLMYDMRISDLVTNEPLHLETGMWLNLADVQGGTAPEMNIVRSASIPHGDSLLAIGTSSSTAGPPDITVTSALPFPLGGAPNGYDEDWDPPEHPSPISGVPGVLAGAPNEVLKETIAKLDIVETTTLSVSTENGGGILNIPFVDANAKATTFSCDYWIETIQPPTPPGQQPPPPVQQLQYSQTTNIEFLQQFDSKDPTQLITWPHVNVNTLRKQ